VLDVGMLMDLLGDGASVGSSDRPARAARV
jgi:hypothetical protein